MTTNSTNLKPSEVKALITHIEEKANIDMSQFKDFNSNYYIAFGEKSVATKSLELFNQLNETVAYLRKEIERLEGTIESMDYDNCMNN